MRVYEWITHKEREEVSQVSFNLKIEVKTSVHCFFKLWIQFEYYVEEATEYIC